MTSRPILSLASRNAEPGRLYSTARWQRLRLQQLQRSPLCVMCRKEGRINPATVADHVQPHRGDEQLFWNGELQSLCASHHSSDKQRIEHGNKPRPRIALDGWHE